MDLDGERRALERRASGRFEWRARVELAVLRVHLGELEHLGTSARYYVARRGELVLLFPLDPPQRVPHVVETVRELELADPREITVTIGASHRYAPLHSMRPWSSRGGRAVVCLISPGEGSAWGREKGRAASPSKETPQDRGRRTRRIQERS